MEKIKIEFSKDNFFGILSKYYSTKSGKEVKIKAESRIKLVGVYEDEVIETTIYREEEVEVLGYTGTKTTPLSLEEINGALSEIMPEQYEISGLDYETEFNNNPNGSRLPSLKGVTLNLLDHQMRLKKEIPNT